MTAMLAGCVPGSTSARARFAFGLRQSAWTEFGTTLFLVAYLFFLRCFNTRPRDAGSEHTVTAADFTVFVTGLSACGLRSSRTSHRSQPQPPPQPHPHLHLSRPRRDQPWPCMPRRPHLHSHPHPHPKHLTPVEAGCHGAVRDSWREVRSDASIGDMVETSDSAFLRSYLSELERRRMLHAARSW